MAGTYKCSIFNSEIIGAFSYTNDKFCFLPKNVDEKVKRIFSEALEVEVAEITIAESPLIGIFLIATNNKALVPWNITKEEIDTLKSYFDEVVIFNSKYNAIGNFVSFNSNGVLIHFNLNEEEIEQIKEVLNVNFYLHIFL